MKLRNKIALTLMYLWAASAVGWVSLSVVLAFFAPHLLLDNLFAGLFLVVGVGVVVAVGPTASEPLQAEALKLSFLSVLTLLFVALKLTDHIDWSWWWVLSPIWIPVALVGAFIAIVGLVSWIATERL